MTTDVQKLFKQSKFLVFATLLLTVQIVPFVSFWSNTASAASTLSKAPTSTHAPNGWDVNTVTNMQNSDDTYVSEAGGSEQGYKDFDLGIPDGSTIQGVEVEVEANSSDASGCRLRATLSSNGGSNYTGYQSMNLSDIDTTVTLGGSTNTWGRAWAAADFSNENFVIKVQDYDPGADCINDAVTSVDFLNIKIHFTAPEQRQTEQKGTLIVKKVLVQDDGATEKVTDFSYRINGGSSTAFEQDGQSEHQVEKNTYSVFENLSDRYTTTYENCHNVYVDSGETEICTITNDDTDAQLYVTKHVINNNGGQKMSSDFSLYVNGTKLTEPSKGGGDTDDNSVTYQYPNAQINTPYAITEDGELGYQHISTTCTDNANDQQVPQPVVLNLGQRVTCIVSNNDKPAKLSIKKLASPDNNTQAFAFSGTNGNFSLSSGGTYVASNLSEGTTFTVTEQLTEGWELGQVTCNNTESWTQIERGVQVELHNGDDVTCVFYNEKDREHGSISGFKLNDTNGNSLADEGEEKLSGWTIQLYKECESREEIASFLNISNDAVVEEDCFDLVDETVTGEDGYYQFSNLLAGTYKVCELEQDGWMRTFPVDSECHTVVVDEGEDCEANFANKAKEQGQVLGTVTPSTPQVLANTGTPFVQGFIVGMSIIGAAGSVSYLTRRRQHVS